MKFIQIFCCLRVEVNVSREVEPLHIIQIFNNDGVSLGLSYQPEHLGVAVFSEDDNLRLRRCLILPLDAALQLQHHWAGGIDEGDIVLAGKSIGGRRFSVSAQQHLHVVQLGQLVVINGDESLSM